MYAPTFCIREMRTDRMNKKRLENISNDHYREKIMPFLDRRAVDSLGLGLGHECLPLKQVQIVCRVSTVQQALRAPALPDSPSAISLRFMSLEVGSVKTMVE